MSTDRRILATLLIVSMLALCGCPDNNSVFKRKVVRTPEGRDKIETTLVLSRVIKTSNLSYIPINEDSKPEWMNPDIINVIDVFKEANPQLEIVGLPKIDRDSPGWGSSNYRYHGVWIYHRQK